MLYYTVKGKKKGTCVPVPMPGCPKRCCGKEEGDSVTFRRGKRGLCPPGPPGPRSYGKVGGERKTPWERKGGAIFFLAHRKRHRNKEKEPPFYEREK